MKTPYRYEQREVNGHIEYTEFFREGGSEVTTFKVTVGDVAVTPADVTNPYRYHGPYSVGPERAKALALFRQAGTVNADTFIAVQRLVLWYVPSAGGCLRISPACVDWGTT